MAEKVSGMGTVIETILEQKLADAVYWFDVANARREGSACTPPRSMSPRDCGSIFLRNFRAWF